MQSADQFVLTGNCRSIEIVKYSKAAQMADKHPEILVLAHQDLKKLSRGSHRGREGDFTSETILRALVVHAIEGLSLRETVVRIAESEFLQDFVRTRKKAVVETNIHWPTDSSLLWDTWRMAARLLREGRTINRQTCSHRFHDRKTKRL